MSDVIRKQQIIDYPANTAMDEYDPHPRSRGGRSEWGFTIPGAVTNYIRNPSVERNLVGWGASGGTVVRQDMFSSRGVWGCLVTPNGTTANGACYFSVHGDVPAPGNYCFNIDVLAQSMNQYRIYMQYPAAASLPGGAPWGNARVFHGLGFWNRESIYLTIHQAGFFQFMIEHLGTNNNLLPFAVDGAMLTPANFITYEHEYMDGDTPTARWAGEWHSSHSFSTPDGLVQTGMLNFSDTWIGDGDETPTVTEWQNVSQAELRQSHRPNLYYDGAELGRVYAPPRIFGFSGYLNATRKRQYHWLSQHLETHTRLFPLQRRTSNLYYQPLHCGRPVKPKVYIACTHKGGLKERQTDTQQRKFTMQFEAPDPWFYRFHEEGKSLAPSGVTRVGNTSRLFVIPTFRFIGPGDLTSIENLYVDNVNYPTRIEFDPVQTLLTGTEVAFLFLGPNQIRFEKFDIFSPSVKTIMHGAILPTENSHPTRFFLSESIATPINMVSSYAEVDVYWRPRNRGIHD